MWNTSALFLLMMQSCPVGKSTPVSEPPKTNDAPDIGSVHAFWGTLPLLRRWCCVQVVRRFSCLLSHGQQVCDHLTTCTHWSRTNLCEAATHAVVPSVLACVSVEMPQQEDDPGAVTCVAAALLCAAVSKTCATASAAEQAQRLLRRPQRLGPAA